MTHEPRTTFKISGSALSFMFYECEKSKSDQVGFLIGERHSYIKKVICDSQLNGELTEINIDITSIFPVGSPFLFCNKVGKVDKDKLKEILGPLGKNICGWYIFRRNLELVPLLRGTIIHKGLLEALPNVDPSSFVLCCVGSDANPTRSTYRFRNAFYIYNSRSYGNANLFDPIVVSIVNLGLMHNEDYKISSIDSNSSSTSFNEILSSIKGLSGLQALMALQEPLGKKLMDVAAELQKFDRNTQQLSNEIQHLKDQNAIMKLRNDTKPEKRIKYDSGDIDKDLAKKTIKEDNNIVINDLNNIPENDDSSNEVVPSSQNLELPFINKKDDDNSSSSHTFEEDNIDVVGTNSAPSPFKYTASEEY